MPAPDVRISPPAHRPADRRAESYRPFRRDAAQRGPSKPRRRRHDTAAVSAFLLGLSAAGR